MNNILNDMILPTITVKKKPKKKEEKRKKKKNLGMKRAFNKLRPSLEIKQGVEDKMGRPSSPTLSYDSGFFLKQIIMVPLSSSITSTIAVTIRLNVSLKSPRF